MKRRALFILLFAILILNISYSQCDTQKAYYKGEYYRQQLDPKYPPYAIENAISGEVEFKIHIDNNGCLDSIVIINSPHEVLAEEVKRSISSFKCE